jgi:hypothetical protein
MHPIPGQPGLFHDGARRTALSDFMPNPPASGYTWDVPRGQPWTIGDLPSLRAQWTANEQRYNEIKLASQPLLAAHPFDGASYADMARQIITTPSGSTIRLTQAQFATITRAVLSETSQGQAQAAALLNDASRSDRARKILFNVKSALDAYDRALRGIMALSRQASAAARAVGLGDPLTTGGIIAIVIGVAFVILVGAVLLYAVFSSVQAIIISRREANEACARDAAAGRPCTGAQWLEYRERSAAAQRDFGLIPSIDELIRQIGSFAFWGGLLAVGGLLAYAAWTAEPARRNVQERLRRASDPGTAGLGRLCDEKEARQKSYRDAMYADPHDPSRLARARASYEEAEEDCWKALDEEVRGPRKRRQSR